MERLLISSMTMRILYIDIDSLRPDHLGCYGYHRNTSPTIDAIAKEAVRFDNCYTPDAPCLPSRTAFYTGRFGIHTGVVGHGGTAADPFLDGASRGFQDTIGETSLPTRLQQGGFHTAQISPFGQRHSARQFMEGFNEIHNTGQGGMESAETVTPVVMKWLDDNASKDNWYLHVNYWDPHTPYRTPEGYPNHFENDPLPDWINDEVFEEHLKAVGPHSAREIGMYTDEPNPKYPKHPNGISNRDGLRQVMDGYDSGVRYVDDQIAMIVNSLKEQGVYEDTVVIISADHGENIGELGLYSEHGTADEITCRIPMIVKWPGMARGTSNSGLRYNLDWAPTLCELLDIGGSDNWDGQSYAEAIRTGEDAGRDQLVISQCCHVCQRSVRWGPWLYMRTYHCGFHLFPQEMLYNLEKDPHEQVNLAATHPELCREGAHRLMQWHEEAMKSSTSNVDPLWTVMQENGPFHANTVHMKKEIQEYFHHLRATDRAYGVEEIKKRYPELRELD